MELLKTILFYIPIPLILLLLFATSERRAPRGYRVVPGPRGLPVLGNSQQLTSQPQQQLRVWAQKYGELFRLNLGWETWVFINNPEAAKAILDKQSSVTSGRPPMPVAANLVSGGMRLVMMSYTAQWRKLRAIVHKLLTPKSSETFKASQEFEAKQLVYDLLTRNENLEDFYMHVRRYTTSVVMTSTYGKRVPDWACEDFREVYSVMDEFSHTIMPGTFVADLFPPLASIPTWLQWWRKRALSFQRRQAQIWLKHWRGLRQQILKGQAPDCFVKGMVETEAEVIGELQSAFVAGTMIEAGSETTSSALNSAIKYLAANPSVQESAHEELTAVVGEEQSPIFADEGELPYIRAMVKEILRLRPVTRFGPPHYTTADIKYKDYFIPKNTVLSVAHYVVHFDPTRYDDPFAFKPERFLNHPLKAGAYAAVADPYERDHFGFGSGRRICPGMHLAENSLFITLAKILWAFHIAPPISAEGTEDVMDLSDNAYEPGMDTLPKRYKVRFVPRSEERRQIIVREWQTAAEEGFHLGNVKVDVTGMVAL
ncbi:O-methylsterigmatocystin oxidoreductase [Ilyonectria destructans]|nr:O-methylsterigmatocystin oxidoreductase [Ilyonectria destructans]